MPNKQVFTTRPFYRWMQAAQGNRDDASRGGVYNCRSWWIRFEKNCMKSNYPKPDPKAASQAAARRSSVRVTAGLVLTKSASSPARWSTMGRGRRAERTLIELQDSMTMGTNCISNLLMAPSQRGYRRDESPKTAQPIRIETTFGVVSIRCSRSP